MKKTNISHVNNEHNRWLRSLNFYKTEISILKGLLTEIAGKNTGSEVAMDVEHFENQFKIQNENIDVLAHDIHANIHAISTQVQGSSAGYIDDKLVEEHAALGERYLSEEVTVRELTQEFRKFAEKWM